ncbi:TlpA disulfide reductase family protein [Azospirillum griseum]|uniref:TlpA family protein disulfide reductase n=1 Tax=Azospirillum griseum TaxID=2496639 RepID=A0A431VA18_9PROT|nr:TlpA disulfide reductase family protein [Azospirillum griseum]RTR13106.1 TlpA family protein disulfide reductase [Azospirillum griseum]
MFNHFGRLAIPALLGTFGLLLGAHAHAESFDPPPLRNGQGQFVLLEPQTAVPSTPLHRLDGSVTTMEEFRGRIVLINFWATWCAPCVREMPALDALAAAVPSGWFVVAAVSFDQDDGQRVRAFVARHGLKHLTVLLDPDRRFGTLGKPGTASRPLPLYGLPASYVANRSGRATGYLVGPMAWDTPQARSFIDYLLTFE